MRKLLVALILASLGGSALAQDCTQAAVEAAVEKHIVPKLKEAGLMAVSLEPILWADNRQPAPAGAGLSQILANTLASHKIGLTVGARAVLGGTLARVVDEQSNPPAPALKLVLRLKFDQKAVCEVPVLILMEGTLPIDPVEIAVPVQSTPKERAEIIKKAREQKEPAEQAGPVRWSPDGTIGIEMLIAKTQDVRQARLDRQSEGQVNKLFAVRHPDRQGFVKTADGESCRFRLTNKNSFSVAGELRVAGVDWSEFATVNEANSAKKQNLLVVIPANSSVLIRGWYRNAATSLTFDVKNLPASAAGRVADIGVVSFTYHACWKKNQQPPPGDEEATARLSQQNISQGAVQSDKFELVERIMGRLRGSVTLKYGEFAK